MADRQVAQALARGRPGPIGPVPTPVWTSDTKLSFLNGNGDPYGPSPVNLIGIEGPAGEIQNFETLARAVASVISPLLLSIRIYRSADGAPLFPKIYVAGAPGGPGAFQDAGGTWWQLDLSNSALLNERLSKTAAYPVNVADNGKTIALGGGAFFTLTFNAASGYATNFQAIVLNEDSSRGKTIACNGIPSFILWPGWSCLICNQNNVWKILFCPQYYKLTAATTFFVDKLGSDSNDGLAATTGAFLTEQHAIDMVSRYVDANGFQLSVSVGDGTWTENLNLKPVRGIEAIGSHNELILSGNIASLGNTIQNPASGNAIHALNNGSTWRIQGFKFVCPGGLAISAEFGANIYLGNNDYGACAGGHINSAYGSKVELVDNYKISGDTTSHFIANFGGQLLESGTLTITLSGGTRAFSAPFCVLSENSVALLQNLTFVGSATGQRYYAITGGGIQTLGGGANYFPGNAAGAVVSPGWYA